jgi:hypothetical protein
VPEYTEKEDDDGSWRTSPLERVAVSAPSYTDIHDIRPIRQRFAGPNPNVLLEKKFDEVAAQTQMSIIAHLTSDITANLRCAFCKDQPRIVLWRKHHVEFGGIDIIYRWRTA